MTRADRPGRESSSGPDANPDRHQKTPPSPKREVVSMVTAGSPLVCWRCGTAFARTDEAALARCAELARGAVEERAAGLCAACAAAVAP
jgi:hypothetical protein